MLAAFVLAVDFQPIGLGPTGLVRLHTTVEQPRLDRRGVQLLGQRPTQTSPLGARQVIAHAGPTDSDAAADFALAVTLRRQAQHFADMAHR